MNARFDTPDPDGVSEPRARSSTDGQPGLRVTVEGIEGPITAEWLEALLWRAGPIVEADRGTLEVTLVDDATMAELHERHRGESGSTDVLSFDLREDETAPLEAELVLCVPEAERQAAARGHAAADELLLYGVHGLLHAMGEDDEAPAAAARMRRAQERAMRDLGRPGVAPPADQE